MKIDKKVVAKIIAAALIPGGFIAWGAYELGKRIGSKDSDRVRQEKRRTDEKKD